jgi:hypothetical protein
MKTAAGRTNKPARPASPGPGPALPASAAPLSPALIATSTFAKVEVKVATIEVEAVGGRVEVAPREAEAVIITRSTVVAVALV